MPIESFVALGLYFACMLAIGLFAYKTSTNDVKAYMLGGRQVSPQVTALSAGASDMSGWMLMGLPGAMFVMGFDALLIAVGLLLGAFLNYTLVAPRLRTYTQMAGDSITVPEFFSKRFGKNFALIRLVTAVVVILFFTLYTSAGLVAGGKLFESAFGLSYEVGLIVTASVVIAYTLLGGFLAVSLTDFVQGCIMFVALVAVPIVAYQHFSSAEGMLGHAQQSIPSFGESVSNLTMVGVASSLAWGLGYFGQPHIIVRFMAIRKVQDIPAARAIGMSWMTVTIIGAVTTGLIGVAYVNKFNYPLSDPETIFIVFSQLLFHPLISGFLLAAILAAVMSTISSQLLVSSSSLTEDLFGAVRSDKLSSGALVNIGRASVFVVALVAALIALDRSSSILDLVSNAWAGFGAAFGPLVLLSLFWPRMTHAGALAGIASGTITVLFCIYAPILEGGQTISAVVYELIPGFAVSGISIIVVSFLTLPPGSAVKETFISMKKHVDQAA